MGSIIKIIAKYQTLLKAIFYRTRVFNLFIVAFSYLFRFPKVKGFPPIVQIEPTNRCNLHCCLCLTGLGKLRRQKGDMSIGNFEKIIGQLEKGIIYLVLYNLGEPLLNPDIYQMVQYAKRKRVFIRLSTNGEFVDNENIKKIVNYGIDELVISLDYAPQQTYLKYKKSPNFKMVIENVKSIIKERGKRLKPYVNLQLLITIDTEEQIPEFRKMARDLGVDRSLIKKVRVNFPEIEPDRNLLPLNSKYIRKAYKNNFRRDICYRPWISTLVFWDGSIVPCCFDMQGEYNFGNIFNMSFEKIWNNINYASFREQILKSCNQIPLCRQCSLQDFFDNYS